MIQIGQPRIVRKQAKAFALLGAYGDICALLPFLWREAQATRQKQFVIVAEQFASIFDGVSYVEPVVFSGHYAQLLDAIVWAQQRFSNVLPLQMYGGSQRAMTDSFVKDMWLHAGAADEWDRWPLIFDRRSDEREKAFRIHSGKPIILCLTEGKSSPFPYRKELAELLKSAFPDFEVIESVNAERVYDMIAAYDQAAILISSDTVHLHLSRASRVPVIALVTDKPTRWHGCPAYGNQVLRVRYSDYPEMKTNILSAVHASPPITYVPRLIHVYTERAVMGDNLRRKELAMETWRREYGRGIPWQPCPLMDNHLPRLHESDGRKLPYVRDLIDYAAEKWSTKDHDLIAYTNDDTCFTPGLTQYILSRVPAAGAAWGQRWDFPRLVRPLEAHDVRNGRWYPGSDLHIVSVSWWRKYREQFPDMVVGYECPDWILRELIKQGGGVELYEAIYHERHDSWWEQNRLQLEGNKHNRRLAREWLQKRGLPIAELAGVE